MLYRKEANSKDRKSNIEKWEGGSIVEMRRDICLKNSNMTKCLNTFVAHCSLLKFETGTSFWLAVQNTLIELHLNNLVKKDTLA